MSDSDSSVSSSYSSDGPYLMSYGKTYDSDEPDGNAVISEHAFPSSVLSQSEQHDMLRTLHEESDKPSFWIFPQNVRKHLSDKFPLIKRRLEELLQQDCAIIIAGRSLLNLTEASWQGRVPMSVICDVCVFSPAHPLMILTFTTPTNRPETAVRHNSYLARSIIRAIKGETQLNFNVFHGVLDENVCQARETFLETINHFEKISHALGALSSPTHDMYTVLKAFLKVLHDNQLQRQSNRENKEQDIETERTTAQEASSQMMALEDDTATGENSHVSTLPERPDDQSPCLEASATGENDNGHAPIQRREYDDLLKRIEQLEQRQEDILQEKEMLHQDYLTDVRLSLLMRVRSSSFSKSDSGFSSSTLTSDKGGMADTGKGDKHDRCEAQGQHLPQLTRKEIDGGNLELVKFNREASLHEACQEGNLDAVTHIVSGGLADINCRDRLGRTPVMVAAKAGHLSVVNFLIRQGCGILEVDDNNDTVLHVACVSRNVDVVKCILSSNTINMEKRGRYGWTAIVTSAFYGAKNVFDFLIRKGCDLSVVDDDGDNILHLACLGGNVDICKYLLSNNVVNIESRGQYNRTPVMTAAIEGHRELFDFLVSKGCDLSVVDGNGYNILHVTCLGGNVDICKYLLSKDIVGIESKEQYNRTPVMIAANQGHRELFDFLVSKGCDLSVGDRNGQNILDVTCLAGNVDICKYLLSKDIVGIESRGQYNRTPVMTAASKGHRELFDFLVSKGCDLSVGDRNGQNILDVTCLAGNVDICKYLLSKDIVGIESRGQYNRTPVMTAAIGGHRELFDFLVSKGCDLSVVDGNGNNILHVTCIGGNFDICKYLVTRGITDEMCKKNKRGEKPLQVAESHCHKDVVGILKYVPKRGLMHRFFSRKKTQ